MAAAAVSAQNSPAPAYNSRLAELLNAYQDLINTPPRPEMSDSAGVYQDPAGNAWETIEKAAAAGLLRFSPDPSVNSILEGARFQAASDSKTAYVLLSTSLLDIWEKRPALAYTVLTRLFREVSIYFQNPAAWNAARIIPMDSFILRMDSYDAAALFIRDRIQDSDLQPGAYEEYILASFTQDNLAGAALFLERISLDVSNALQQLRFENETEANPESIRQEILSIGESLLKNRDLLEDGSDDQTIYPHAVAIHTWLEFTPWMMSRLNSRGTHTPAFDTVLEREPDYARLRRMLDARRIIDMPIIDHVHKSNIKGFEAG